MASLDHPNCVAVYSLPRVALGGCHRHGVRRGGVAAHADRRGPAQPRASPSACPRRSTRRPGPCPRARDRPRRSQAREHPPRDKRASPSWSTSAWPPQWVPVAHPEPGARPTRAPRRPPASRSASPATSTRLAWCSTSCSPGRPHRRRGGARAGRSLERVARAGCRPAAPRPRLRPRRTAGERREFLEDLRGAAEEGCGSDWRRRAVIAPLVIAAAIGAASAMGATKAGAAVPSQVGTGATAGQGVAKATRLFRAHPAAAAGVVAAVVVAATLIGVAAAKGGSGSPSQTAAKVTPAAKAATTTSQVPLTTSTSPIPTTSASGASSRRCVHDLAARRRRGLWFALTQRGSIDGQRDVGHDHAGRRRDTAQRVGERNGHDIHRPPHQRHHGRPGCDRRRPHRQRPTGRLHIRTEPERGCLSGWHERLFLQRSLLGNPFVECKLTRRSSSRHGTINRFFGKRFRIRGGSVSRRGPVVRTRDEFMCREPARPGATREPDNDPGEFDPGHLEPVHARPRWFGPGRRRGNGWSRPVHGHLPERNMVLHSALQLLLIR